MRTVKIDLYQFEELTSEAKQKAIIKYRDFNLDHGWWEFVYEDFINLCSTVGIVVNKNSIAFDGFYSQGDGSGFSADVDIIKLKKSIENENWKSYAPRENFQFPPNNIDRRVMGLIEKGGILLESKIINSRNGNYVVADMGGYPSNGPRFHNYIYSEIDLLEEWLKQVAMIFNRFLYKSLENEYEYRTSDEAVSEALASNEIPFTADGRSALALEKLMKKS
jgi:hypothetical protein